MSKNDSIVISRYRQDWVRDTEWRNSLFIISLWTFTIHLYINVVNKIKQPWGVVTSSVTFCLSQGRRGNAMVGENVYVIQPLMMKCVCNSAIDGSHQPWSGCFDNSYLISMFKLAHPVPPTGVTQAVPCVIMSIWWWMSKIPSYLSYE